MKIDLHGHLLRLRGDAVKNGRRPLAERIGFRVFRWAAAKPERWARLVGLARRFQGPAVRFGLLKRWTDHREAPVVAPRSFREMWRDDG